MKKRENNSEIIIKILFFTWITNVLLIIIGLVFSIYIRVIEVKFDLTNIIRLREMTRMLIAFWFPYFIQPIAIFLLVITNILYITKTGKRIFNSFILFCFFVFQIIPALSFLISLFHLIIGSSVYEVIRNIISILFIVFTYKNYIFHIKDNYK